MKGKLMSSVMDVMKFCLWFIQMRIPVSLGCMPGNSEGTFGLEKTIWKPSAGIWRSKRDPLVYNVRREVGLGWPPEGHHFNRVVQGSSCQRRGARSDQKGKDNQNVASGSQEENVGNGAQCQMLPRAHGRRELWIRFIGFCKQGASW